MKFFADTAEIDEIRDLAATGLLDGVTTNPSLVHKSGRDFLEVVREICGICPGPVSAEVVALDHDHRQAGVQDRDGDAGAHGAATDHADRLHGTRRGAARLGRLPRHRDAGVR